MCEMSTTTAMMISAAVSALGIGTSFIGQANSAAQAAGNAAAAKVAAMQNAVANMKYQVAAGTQSQQLFMAQAEQAQATAASQNAYMRDTAAYQEGLYELNTERATDAYYLETDALQQKAMEEEASASQQTQDIQRERTEKLGHAVASSDAAGINLDLLVGNYYRQEARVKDAISHNLEITDRQIEREKDSAQVRADSRIRGYQRQVPAYHQVESPIYKGFIPQPVSVAGLQSTPSGPNPWASLTTFGGSAWDSYTKLAIATGTQGKPNWSLGF